jgi:ParB-like chromosome segregation protein Spo0J
MSALKPTDPRQADREEAIELATPKPPPDVLGTAHPVAELFPLLPSTELDALAADIQANGLREPIWRHRDGRIIDGRNRWLACQMAGVECPCRVFMGDDAELLQFVLSMNLRRRHLDESQRAMVAAKVANLGEGRPKKTSRIQPVSQASAAALLRVGVSSVKAAKQVRTKGAPEVVKAVEEGRLAVSTAAGLAARPQGEQRAILAKVEQAPQVAGRKKLRPERRRPMPTQARKLTRGTGRAVAASDGEQHTGKTIEEEPTDAAAAGDLPPRAGHSPSEQAMRKGLEEFARAAHAATPAERARFWGDARPTFEALTSLFQAAASIDAPPAPVEAETKIPSEEPAAPAWPIEPELGTAELRNITPPAEAEDAETPVAGDGTAASVSDHDRHLSTGSGGQHLDGAGKAPCSTDAGQVARAAAGKACKRTLEEVLDEVDDRHLAEGRKRYGPTRDPSLPPPRAVLGIPDDALLTRPLIRAAFARREDAMWGDGINRPNDEFKPLEEARHWLLEEVDASEPEPRDDQVPAASSDPVKEPVGPAA